MKTPTIILISLLSLSCFATTHQLRGDKAQVLFQALLHSGVEVVDTDAGFNMLEPASISCKGSQEQRYTGGMLSKAPVCFKKAAGQSRDGFNFDQLLANPVSLMKALSVSGADMDAGLGSYYASAQNIYCKYTELSRVFKCSFETVY